MMTLSPSQMINIVGGAGTGYDAPGEACKPNKRSLWQKVAPTALGGLPAYSCNTEGRIWFNKDALTDAPAGERRLTPDAKQELGDLGGKL